MKSDKFLKKVYDAVDGLVRRHYPVFLVVDNATWVLSALFVLGFLFWFHDHPYPWFIGPGLLVLLLKLACIVFDPNRKKKKKE